MAESLFNRVRRLVAANTAELLERSAGEAPIAAALRAAEAARAEALAERETAANQLRQAQRQRRLVTEHLAQLAEKAEIAVRQGRDDLAAVALSRQIDLEAQIPLLDAAAAEAQAESAKLEVCIEALSARIAALGAHLPSAGAVEARESRDAAILRRLAELKEFRRAG
jgi:phage shock protein A